MLTLPAFCTGTRVSVQLGRQQGRLAPPQLAATSSVLGGTFLYGGYEPVFYAENGAGALRGTLNMLQQAFPGVPMPLGGWKLQAASMVKSFGVQPGVYLGSVLTHHPAADILSLGQLHKSRA